MNNLETSLKEGRFCFTAEVVPPLAAAGGSLLEEAGMLHGRVEAINVTDGAAARTSMSSAAAAALLAANGMEPVLQLTCRDRNRIALCADLLGCAALGVSNLLLLTGDDPAGGDQPEARAVHDINSTALVAIARDMSEQGILPNGRKIDSPPRFFIGSADVPQRPAHREDPPHISKKTDAGARFIQTQLCYDIGLIEAYVDYMGEWGIAEKAGILIGLGPVASARSARWMRENLWGVSFPDSLVQRLEDSSDPKREGRRICIELIERMQNIDGIAGRAPDGAGSIGPFHRGIAVRTRKINVGDRITLYPRQVTQAYNCCL